MGIGQYKFYAAFENSRCEGYITEKFFRGLIYGMVPIAMGGLSRRDYESIVPGDSFLHVDDFDSVEDLANRLVEIDQDDTEYNKFHAWRSKLHVMGQGDSNMLSYCE